MAVVLDTLVIGGGQAGLASGYHLQRKGLNYLILEANDQVGGSWPEYYDSLRLFSPARYASLPGLPFPGHPSRYPLKEEVIKYLRDYAVHFSLPIQTRERVTDILKGNFFTVITEAGTEYSARTIINAAGSFHSPYHPDIPSHEAFLGNVLHSSKYRTPNPFAGQRNIVVGRGNSAVQIGIELSGVSHTTLAVLQPVKLIKQRPWGQDLHFWLRLTGIDTFPFWRLGKSAPRSSSVIDLGGYKEHLDSGSLSQKAMFSSFYEDGVIWANGTLEPVDNVIYATGYRPNLPYLFGLGALDTHGAPLQLAGVSTAVPGVYYVGQEGQRSLASATLRGVGQDAKFVVRKLRRFLQ